MADPRHQKLAKVLVNYSLGIKAGDKLVIYSPAIAEPLIKEIYREATRLGAYVTPRIRVPDLDVIFLQEASETQLQHVSELDQFENEYFDAELYIMADENTRRLSTLDPKRMALRRAARAALSTRHDERSAAGLMRWCLTLYPTNAYAQDAGMPLDAYADFVFNAGLLDQDDPVAGWEQVRQNQQHIVEYLMKHDEIHIVTPDTDIKYRVGGRKWINADGKVNFPDGEVFSAPIEDSVNGFVTFSYPAIYNGNEVEGVRLRFENGKVVEADAKRGLDYLNAMLDMDAGSRILGEVAFGTNYNIQQFTREILFDEKIGGTMHMALGAAYKECGGLNESGLHWDMICDLRDGKVYADGELCYENGKFII